MQFTWSLLLPAIAALPAQGATFARVCQANNVYAPLAASCRGYKSAIAKAYPSGTIFQSDHYSACETVYSMNDCKISLCAFPLQGVNSSLLTTAVDDIINNCQSTSGNVYTEKTGGYNIITGTNVTIGISGNNVDYNVKPLSTINDVAIPTDCQNLLNALTLAKNYTQTDRSGCSILSSNKTCTLNYCDVQGNNITGWELYQYASAVMTNATKDGKVSGFAEIAQTNTKRIGLFAPVMRLPPMSDTFVCTNSSAAQPYSRDCQQAANSLAGQYGTSINQTQKNAPCVRVATNGTCQINLCTQYGDSVPTDKVSQAVSSLIGRCHVQQNTVEGYVDLAGTPYVVAITHTDVPRNIFCNSAPNNSPKSVDVTKMLKEVNKTQIYTSYDATSPQGCKLLLQSGTAKINMCSHQGTTITGSELLSIGQTIAQTCASGDYTSGVLQLNPYTNISIYDPPNDSDFVGIVTCDPRESETAYPDPYDCMRAVQQINAEIDNGAYTQFGLEGCQNIKTYGSCQVVVCGHSPVEPENGVIVFGYVPARLVSNAANEIVEQCRFYPINSPSTCQGALGVRGSGSNNDWSVKVLHAGSENLLRVTNGGGTALTINYTPLGSTGVSYYVNLQETSEGPAVILSYADTVGIADALARRLTLKNGLSLLASGFTYKAAGYDAYTGFRMTLTVAPDEQRSLVDILNGWKGDYTESTWEQLYSKLATSNGQNGGFVNGGAALQVQQNDGSTAGLIFGAYFFFNENDSNSGGYFSYP